MLYGHKKSIDSYSACQAARYEQVFIAPAPVQALLLHDHKAAYHRDEAAEKYDLHDRYVADALDADIHQGKEESGSQHVQHGPIERTVMCDF
jgi:hypothetical protein